MKRFFIIFLFVLGINISIFSQPYQLQDSVHRVVFLGNSITYMGQYISYINTYYALHYPNKNIEFINVGLPSETVSGLSEPNHADGVFPRPDLHERLERVLKITKPDLVLACYGMNDGIYLPFDDVRFQKYRDGINWLHQVMQNFGIPIIHITPAIYDERHGKAYANVLDIYSDWLLSCRYTKNWKVIDIHWPMKKYLEYSCLQDSLFRFADDGIHPNHLGHFIMAQHILSYLGENEMSKAKSIQDYIFSYENGDSVLQLVESQQNIMKDAWLTYIGHTRPWMNKGFSLDIATHKCDSMKLIIQRLPKCKIHQVAF